MRGRFTVYSCHGLSIHYGFRNGSKFLIEDCTVLCLFVALPWIVFEFLVIHSPLSQVMSKVPLPMMCGSTIFSAAECADRSPATFDKGGMV